MYKILIVEDDEGLAGAIVESLSGWEFDCRTVSDFRHVAAEFCEYEPHLVLMDISLPFFNGYYWCGEIRKKSNTPIIFLSSASDNLNIVMAMDMGADDFIAKPFDTGVLTAKIRAMLRRSYDFAQPQVISHGGAELNLGDGTVSAGGKKAELTKNELRILLTLLENRGRTVSREKLMQALWETDSFVDENTLTVNVGRLRRKLEGLGLSGYITTKFGMGYMIGE